ncbi:Aste57867_2727 [Aphanomyces stellatus]|uniref:Aste57867_2727 protein n=1 Tax=Aphanomyces stellatus TaxID=120398 RepID=A0A485K9T7_9STRA|nr:hypothetical protein As57867_002720 [Aphanomyces stellatus]VFT79919.1 Aste57867_2727 [Aphanomyces stellatus]
MLPRGDETRIRIQAAVKEGIQRRVQEKLLQVEVATNQECMRQDVIAIACGILDKCARAKSLDTVDTRLQLSFVRRMLAKELELERLSRAGAAPTNLAEGADTTRFKAVTTPTSTFRLSQHLKAPLPAAARGHLKPAWSATESSNGNMTINVGTATL